MLKCKKRNYNHYNCIFYNGENSADVIKFLDENKIYFEFEFNNSVEIVITMIGFDYGKLRKNIYIVSEAEGCYKILSSKEFDEEYEYL